MDINIYSKALALFDITKKELEYYDSKQEKSINKG